MRKVTSHSVGAIDTYASPRERLRRNARWLIARAVASIVWYVCDQSTERPPRRHSASNAFSSSAVSVSHSSTKLRREIASCCLPGFSGGVNSGSYGRLGSQRTP